MKNSALTIQFITQFAKLLLTTTLLTMPSMASLSSEGALCGQAVRSALKGTNASVSASECPLSSLFIMWLRLQEDASFSEIQNFISKHPHWPRQQKLQKKAEEQLSVENIPAAKIVAWFTQYPPISAQGAISYVRALLHLDRKDDALLYIKESWPKLSMDLSDVQRMTSQFSSLVPEVAYFARASHLLNEEDHSQISWLMTKLSSLHQQIIQTRQALQKQLPNCQKMVASLPEQAWQDPGLVLDVLRWYRKQENNEEMLKTLKSQEISESLREYYWREANILIRRLMDEHRYQDAYTLAQSHGLSRGESFANGEWLAGWLALRFNEQPTLAIEHFQKLLSNVGTPISVARASYWLGRAYEATGDHEQAKVYYTQAKDHPATYYGQLAHKHLVGKDPTITLKQPTISSNKRQAFEKREMVQIVHLLHKLNETHVAEPFLHALAQIIDDVDEQVLLVNLAHEKLGHYGAVDVCKKSTKTKTPLIPIAYPRVDKKHAQHLASVDAAFVHAIIRQESRFKHNAVSSAGASGLMQLMPATAKQTALKLKMKDKKLPLHDPKTNVQLGSAHLKGLLDRYNGSMILAAAAYNAGAHVVDKWLIQYGDPRQPGVDPVDWVELIPYAETRNYVQRVRENYYCYR
jgi:soluble lytic murein transglycosylase